MIRKKLSMLILILLALLLAVSCTAKEETERIFYTVTFDTVGGSPQASVSVVAGSKIVAPPIPVRENHIFDGWANGNVTWNFGLDSVNSNITLTARWVNAASVFDYVTKEDGTATLTNYKASLKTLTVPEVISGYKITALGDSLFENFVKEEDTLYSISLPEGITEIGASAFEGLEGVEISVAGWLSEIGERAFYGCTGLTEIYFSETLTVISYESFMNCTGLSSVVLPESVEKIEENAFQNCTGITSVVFGKTLKTIEDGAFKNCERLGIVYFRDSEADFDLIDISLGGDGNDVLFEAKLFIYSSEKPESGNYWYYDDKDSIKHW